VPSRPSSALKSARKREGACEIARPPYFFEQDEAGLCSRQACAVTMTYSGRDGRQSKDIFAPSTWMPPSLDVTHHT
jgi:hypothetical protein